MQANTRGRFPLSTALALIALCAACGDDLTSNSSLDPTSGAGGEPTTSGHAGGAGGTDGAGGFGGTDGQGGDGGSDGQGGFGGGFDEPLVCNGPGPIFATHVLATSFGPGQSFGREGMPEIALGHPVGGGCCQGSLDVVSLGDGGMVVLGFAGNAIADGPGPDFVVFENVFEIGTMAELFTEPATVEVSTDGLTWSAFPCPDAPFEGCAGVSPVFLDADVSAIDITTHGGDAFDLADVGVTEARFVRITDRVDLGSVFDLDAVGIVHPVCP